MRHILSLAALLCLLAALPGQTRAEDGPVSLSATPKTIAINSLYDGTDLTITGRIPAASQLVVRLVGEPTTFTMKEKGKVFGLLWMNLDKVTFGDAPKVFLVAASAQTSGETLAKLGVPGLADRITVATQNGNKASLVAEFLKYQKAEKLYRENAGQVTLGPDTGETRTFSAVLHMPSRLSPGTYTVEALAVKDGLVTAQAESPIAAAFVGAPAFLADMAFGHGTLYGILSSIIAIVGGLVVSRIFSGSKSGAH
jgi:uncharacterized protein (TIGR02186 family)